MGIAPLIIPAPGYPANHRFGNNSTPAGTSVTYSNGSKGSWTDIDGSAISGQEGHWVELSHATLSSAGSGRQHLLDIGLYDGSTTYLAIENIDVGSEAATTMTTGSHGCPLLFPLWVPDGWRVRVRGQDNVGSTYTHSASVISAEGWRGPLSKRWQVYETLGADTANTKGTVVTPNATANTYGTAVSLGTLTRDAIGFFCGFGLNGNTATTAINYRFAITDGTTTLVDPVAVLDTTVSESYRIWHGNWGRYFRMFRSPIPTGTTIYGKVMSSGASAPAVTMTIHCLCI